MLEIKRNDEKLFELAQKCVKDLKIRYPHYSLSQIANEVGIENSVLTRIVKQETKVPSFNNMIKLLAGTNNNLSVVDAIKILNPKSAEVLKEKTSHNAKNPIMSPELGHYFKLPVYGEIMLWASSSAGTTREEIQTEYGNTGIKMLEELLAKNILKEAQGVIRLTAVDKDTKITFDHNTLKQILINSLKEHYSVEFLGLTDNWISYQMDSVEDVSKALKRIHPIMQDTYRKIDAVFSEFKGNNKGNRKIFIGMVADSLHKNKMEE